MGYADGHPVRLVGGRLALDFLNTADWSADGAVIREGLETADDARAWAAGCGLPEVRTAPAAELRAFRAALRRLVLGPERGRDDVRMLETALAEEAPLLAPAASGALVVAPEASLRRLVAASAAALLGDPREAGRIKLCPGHDCGWLFLDETRGGRRRWCSMATCGNRAKARRSYQRATGAHKAKVTR